MAGEVAVEKRVKIGKYQQQMIGLALIASVVLGVCIVLSVFFVKYIIFNAKVIEAKDAAINDYETAIQNSKSLEGLVLGLADNKDLESVALGTADESCFEQVGDKKEKIDYGEKYRTESSSGKGISRKNESMFCSKSGSRCLTSQGKHRSANVLVGSNFQDFQLGARSTGA